MIYVSSKSLIKQEMFYLLVFECLLIGPIRLLAYSGVCLIVFLPNRVFETVHVFD